MRAAPAYDIFRYIRPDLKGISGKIKTCPADFIVEEIPLYEPSGTGSHLYIRLSRDGVSTRDVARQLAQCFSISENDIGYAGLKDKHARAIQTFSVPLDGQGATRIEEKINGNTSYRVISSSRHTNKLRRGHLLGNRFEILVREPASVQSEELEEIVSLFKRTALPNFFGAQRFGIEQKNIEEGRKILLGEKACHDRWLKQMFLSAFQSYLFNRWLIVRMEANRYSSFLPGDIAKKRETGGLFKVSDPDVENIRLKSGEILLTGPIWGSETLAADGEALEFEQTILKREIDQPEKISAMPLRGSRRPAQVWIDDLELKRTPDGIVITFTLPKGSYATVVLREIMKCDIECGGEADE